MDERVSTEKLLRRALAASTALVSISVQIEQPPSVPHLAASLSQLSERMARRIKLAIEPVGALLARLIDTSMQQTYRHSAKRMVAAGLIAGLPVAPAIASGIYTATTLTGVIGISDSQGDIPTSIAYSGNSFYIGTGNLQSSPILQFSSTGTFIRSASANLGIDFRALVVDSAGNILARGFSDNTIYKMGSFAQFSAVASLQGPSIASLKSPLMRSVRIIFRIIPV